MNLRDGFRTRLWPLPTSTVVVAIVLGVLIPRLEATRSAVVPHAIDGFLFTGGADAARSVLEAVAGSLITVTSLTFSLTVVTLQLASSQFSPRLLRTFTRDLVVQATLGLFLGTFAYALTVLRTVRTADDSRTEFVPDLSVTLAFVLAIASVVALIFFLAHLTQTIRVESMLRSVGEDAAATLSRELEAVKGIPAALDELTPDGDGIIVMATSTGFLVRVDEQRLLAAAVAADAVVVIDACPGTWLVEGTPVGAIWAVDTSTIISSDVPAQVSACCVTGFERTSVQDVALGLRQLTDVAVKALSPGINDPTTAIHALDHSAALLANFVRHDLGPRTLSDDAGRTKVVLARPDLGALLSLAIDQPAHYGAADAAILSRLLVLLRELAWVCTTDQRPVVAHELARLRRIVIQQDFDDTDVATLSTRASHVDAALAGTWRTGTRSSS